MIYDEGKKKFVGKEPNGKLAGVCERVIVDHITGEVTCLHAYVSDQPEDDDVCECGRFYYRGAVSHSETK